MKHVPAKTFATIVAGSTLFGVPSAWGESLEELAEEVEKTSTAYNSAVSEQERVAGEISRLDEELASLETRIPAAEEKVNAAAITIYKSGGETENIVSMFLNSNSLSEAIESYQSYSAVLEHHAYQAAELHHAKIELEHGKEELAAEKAKADELVQQAQEARDDAISARTEAQQAASAKEAAEKASASSSTLASDIDWTMTKDEFVNHWGSRIDAYLAGSPLAGYGTLFAETSYRYGTDPRWSPAISTIESGRGAVCFAPHNAWGYMGHSFSSWEEAIDVHVEYLAGPLYGGYLTLRGASTYCPPGGPWYNAVYAEMKKI